MYEPKAKNSITERVVFTGIAVPEIPPAMDPWIQPREETARDGRILHLHPPRRALEAAGNEEPAPPWNR